MCVTKAQLAPLLSAAGASQTTGSVSSSAPQNPSTNVSEFVSSDTPAVIQINGDNPAIVHRPSSIVQIGETYNDLGATITGPQQDLNLGITTWS